MVYTLMLRAARQHLQRTTTITITTTTTTTQQWVVRRCSGTQIHQKPLWPRPPIQAIWVLGGPTLLLRRTFSLDSSLRNNMNKSKSSVSRHQGGIQPSTSQKVKEAGKDFTYLIVILIGLGVTGGLLYAVFHELFSSSSPNTVYGKAFNRVKAHPEIIGAFGEPIKCYGEATRRQRRQHVSHVDYVKDGLKHMRLKFYIEGSEPGMKGTVHTESKENIETGKYEFRYIFVEVDTYPRRTIVVEDNR